MWTGILIVLAVVLLALVIAVIALKKFCPDLSKVSFKPLGAAGPRLDAEFSEKANRVAKLAEDESQTQPGSSSPQAVTVDQHVRQLEKQNEILKKQILATSTIALWSAAPYLHRDRAAYLAHIRDAALVDVSQSDAHSDLVEYVYPLLRECSTCASFRQNASGKGICATHNSQQSPGDVCDDWVSYPKS